MRRLLCLFAFLPLLACSRPAAATSVPAGHERVVLAGGCFWGIQAVFQHVKGVDSATSGYAGGASATAEYEVVSTGVTGHAESVEVVYDPAQISFAQLLDVFFRVAHDPTELNRQGPDTGTQYRSAIFFTTPAQEREARSAVAKLDAAGAFKSPIVTRIEPLKAFYRAEDYHQNYVTLHPDAPYVAYNDLPKLDHLKKTFPALWR